MQIIQVSWTFKRTIKILDFISFKKRDILHSVIWKYELNIWKTFYTTVTVKKYLLYIYIYCIYKKIFHLYFYHHLLLVTVGSNPAWDFRFFHARKLPVYPASLRICVFVYGFTRISTSYWRSIHLTSIPG